MNWLVIGTLQRGAMEKPELLGDEDSLEATRSLVEEKDLGARDWTRRYHEVGSSAEERYA
jgi:hypothetical protein